MPDLPGVLPSSEKTDLRDMEEREQEALRGKEDKDYGFPFVEVKPLASAESQRSNPSQPLNADPEDSTRPEKDTTVPGSLSNPIHFERNEIRKRNQTPLLVTLVFMLAVILAVMAYFLYYSPPSESSIKETTAMLPETSPEPEPVVEETQSDSIAEELPSTPVEVEEALPEATVPPTVQSNTLPSGAIGKLHLVEAKGERATYHLIIASLPNERIAKAEAQVILDKGRDVWMIFPTGDTKNYRLSVGSFGSFKSASEALPQAKNDHGESTWILKY